MSKNQFKLNPDKTHILLLGTQRRLNMTEENLNVFMDGVQLKENELHCEKMLGCLVQSNLKWSNQISKLKESLKKRLAGVYNLRGVLPFEQLRMISDGWFQSVLVYFQPLLGCFRLTKWQKLQVIQNRFA